MTVDEVGRLLRVIKSAYPNWKPENIQETHDTWSWALGEYDYNKIALALKIYITTDTTGFAPSISQLISKIPTDAPVINEMQAWSMVFRALSNSNYNAEAEFNNLPEPVQKAVGDPDMLRQWAGTSLEEVNTVIQSNFLRTYKSVVEREKDLSALPPSVRNLINQTCHQIAGE